MYVYDNFVTVPPVDKYRFFGKGLRWIRLESKYETYLFRVVLGVSGPGSELELFSTKCWDSGVFESKSR